MNKTIVTVSRKVNLGNYENALFSCTLEKEVMQDKFKSMPEKLLFLRAVENVDEQVIHARTKQDIEKVKEGKA